MTEADTTSMASREPVGDAPGGAAAVGQPTTRTSTFSEQGLFTQYKQGQGKWTRGGTFSGCLLLVFWGGYFLYDRLDIFSGDELWQQLITVGIPLLFISVLGAFTWWISFACRRSSDFMIATEGEMKKVSWSTRRELLGSTKVVIAMTVLMAVLLFVVDLIFQSLFSSIGVLKR